MLLGQSVYQFVKQQRSMAVLQLTTLYSHVRDVVKHQQTGRPTKLSELEEKVVVRACIALETIGYPATRDLVGRVLKQYLADVSCQSSFLSGEPSKKWWSAFFRR